MVHELLEVDHPVAPVTLWIRPSTGTVSQLVTLENDHLHRDSELAVHYGGWAPIEEGLRLPMEVHLTLGRELIHVERRRDLVVNPELAADTFELPQGAAPSYDADLAAWGETSAQFHNQFSALGIPLDFIQSFVQPNELIPGVFHLTGGTHHSLAVEQADGVVIVEPPLYPERSDAVIARARGQFGGKPISHVVITHHHEDHSAGVRSYVAAGSTVVLMENARSYVAETIAAPSKLAPDALANAPVAPTFLTVPLFGALTLPDAAHPIELHHLPIPHASDMLIAYLPNGGYHFQSDLYNPGNGGASFGKPLAQAIVDGIAADNLNVTTLVGGHGGVAPLSELTGWLVNN